MELIILLIVIGLFAGIFVGLTGVGSTLITLPTLLFIFPEFFSKQLAVKMAVANTLAATAICVAIATYLHIKKRNVNYRLFGFMAITYLITAIVGSSVAQFLPLKMLTITVAVALIFIACHMLFAPSIKATVKSFNRFIFAGVITLAGMINSMCGIGTGNIVIPYLRRHYSNQIAMGTSLAATFIACSVAATNYGIHGYIHPLFFSLLTIGITIGTPCGVVLSNKINPKGLKILLATLVLGAGIFAIFETLFIL